MQAYTCTIRTSNQLHRDSAGGPKLLTRVLAILSAILFSLAGALVDRALVATSAWQQLGVQAWADFSRHADNGPGLILYPIWGIAAWLAALATALTFRLDPRAPRSARVPIYVAAAASIGAAAATLKAAPMMLSVGHLANGSSAMREVFDQFTFWGVYVRGCLFVIGFIASVLAVAALGNGRKN